MARHFRSVLVLVGAVSVGCDTEPSISRNSSQGGQAGSSESKASSGGATASAASGGRLSTGQGGVAMVGAAGLLLCTVGETICPSGCTNTMTDPNNCGLCSNRCPGGAVCQSASCAGAAGAGSTAQGGSSAHAGGATSQAGTPQTGGTGSGGNSNGSTANSGGAANLGGTAGNTTAPATGGKAGASGAGGTVTTGGVTSEGIAGSGGIAGAAGKAGTFGNAGAAGNADNGCIDTATTSATMSTQYARSYITTSNNPAKSYVALTNWWGTFTNQTVTVDGIGFSVTNSATTASNNPVGYPTLFIGSYQGNASSGSNLPKQLSNISSVPTVFDTNATSLDTSNINAAYDIWFTATGTPLSSSEYSPGAGGAYVMVWLYKPSNRQPRGSVKASGQVVGTVGNTWDVWVDSSTPPCISYVAKTPIPLLSFDLKDFLTDSTKYGVKTSMYLSVIFAGFEIWSGGNGATVNRFCADVR